MLKPRRLQPGDTVGIVSPSWYGGEPVAHRVERGSAHLRSLGYEVRIAPHALNSAGYVSDTPEHRAADLHTLFADPDVRAIIATIGGDHSCHLLPLLDWEFLQAHPTIFMGFSDMTVLNVAIWSMTGMVTFSGPTLMTDWAEYPQMPAYSERYALKAMCVPEPVGVIEPSPWWTDEFLDWREKVDLTRAREQRPSEGWRWLRDGYGEGVLIGGCLESLEHLRGTPYWPSWEGALLFLETSDEKPPPERVDAMLMDYENMGVFEQIQGLLFARPYGATRMKNCTSFTRSFWSGPGGTASRWWQTWSSATRVQSSPCRSAAGQPSMQMPGGLPLSRRQSCSPRPIHLRGCSCISGPCLHSPHGVVTS